MGCSQSKASTDQVVERVSVDIPAVETPVPESIKVTEPEPVVDAPPASSDELPPAPASVPIEEAPKSEEPVVEEPSTVEEPAVIEEAPKSEEVAAPVDGAPVEEAQQVDGKADAAEDEEKAVEEPVETEETTPEAQPEEAPIETEPEAPKSEPVVNEEPPKSEEAPVETPVEEAAVEEPKLEVAAPEVKTDGTLTFKAEEVTFNDKGVAFYNFDGSDSSNPANDVHVSKRFSEFKTLHAQLSQQLADNQDKALALPSLPKASLLQGRKNQKMLQERKTQFTTLLNAITAHPVASQSDVFKAFLA
eukprot:jgi/Phyca11/506574/fgenesh2_kg.PHYCAscaffold_20_\